MCSLDEHAVVCEQESKRNGSGRCRAFSLFRILSLKHDITYDTYTAVLRSKPTDVPVCSSLSQASSLALATNAHKNNFHSICYSSQFTNNSTSTFEEVMSDALQMNVTESAQRLQSHDEKHIDIESLHLAELDRRYDLDIFPVKEVYEVQMNDGGMPEYLLPVITYTNYCYFKSVKKTRLRKSITERYGKNVGKRIMNRYLSFHFEFMKLLWAELYCNAKNDLLYCEFWREREFLDLAESGVAISERGNKDPVFTAETYLRNFSGNSVLHSHFDNTAETLQWIDNHMQAQEERKKVYLKQYNNYLGYSRRFPT